MIELSVILCTRNPATNRLLRTLAGLAKQTLPVDSWECLLIDNGSEPELSADILAALGETPSHLRVLREPSPGLTLARLRGIRAARGDTLVFVDDDNVLAPGHLAAASHAFRALPSLSAAGGPIRPEFERNPPEWTREFFNLLAVHDHGRSPLVAKGGANVAYPFFAPPGAGLCIRRSAALVYADALAGDAARATLDRREDRLTSGGDNDMVFTALHAGGDVAYLPELELVHLIPDTRISPRYLAQLNRGIQRSWVGVLALHGQRPWKAIPRWSLPLRAVRAAWRTQPWLGPAGFVRWAGLIGRLEGQADLHHP